LEGVSRENGDFRSLRQRERAEVKRNLFAASAASMLVCRSEQPENSFLRKLKIRWKNIDDPGRLEWKPYSACAQWRCCADRAPRIILTEAGSCSLTPTTGSIWRLLRSQTSQGRLRRCEGLSCCLVFAIRLRFEFHLGAGNMSIRTRIYNFALLHERHQALVLQFTEVQMLRARLRLAKAKTIGRRRLAAKSRLKALDGSTIWH
jgi:hypothetical protein